MVERTVGGLAGRRALVTGGASGIGAATARRLAAEGARVAVLDVDGAAAGKLATELGERGGPALVADVADADAVERAVAGAAEALGGLDVLVNNAGAGSMSSLERTAPADFERVVRVNLMGTFHATRAAAAHLRASGRGAVVNNASLSGVRATRGEAPYSAAKAGVVSLTQAAALELAPAVRVNCVSPGLIRTPLTEPLFRMEGLAGPVEEALPLGRAGRADEVAEVIVFLASDAARYVTGQNWVVDGGLGLPQAGIDPALRRVLGLLER